MAVRPVAASRQFMPSDTFRLSRLFCLLLMIMCAGWGNAPVWADQSIGVAPPAEPRTANSIDQNVEISSDEDRVIGEADRLIKQGQMDQAITFYEEALRTAPTDRLELSLARALRSANRPEEAIAHLQAVVDRDPNQFEARWELAQLLAVTGHVEAALTQYRRLYPAHPDNARLRLELARLLNQSAFYGEALGHYDQLLASTPEDVGLRLERAMVLGGAGRLRDAAEEYRRVLKIDPNNTSAAVGLEELRARITPSVKQIMMSVVLVAMVIVLLRMSARWPTATRLNILLVLGIGAWYLWWRATQTLVTDPPALAVISVGLFVAECYGYLTLLFFYIQTWSPIYRKTPPMMDPQALPTVDIYVTIFDEPTEVLYRTLVGCRAIRYPDEKKKIYVLDDGHRDAVREVAERLGCHYLSRPTNEHAKAGNLNYALKRTTGEIIVNFDTDHVPVSTYLERTIGYFRDPQIALVQTAHHFYNPDPYQENLRLTTEIIHEQDLFFQVIQPGRDHYNAAFFCGSGGLFRRSALEAIGGFLTATTTEDIHTSIRLHAKGYRSVYVSDRLAAGLSPESFKSYLKQRDRWAQGHAQILFTRENPLWARGLTFMQRINYLASISYFFLGIPRILYLSAPLFYLLFGAPPLVANIWMLAAYFAPYYVASLLVFNVVSGGRRNPFWSDVYEAAVCFAVTVATARAFIYPRRTTFYVTPKGVRRQKSVVEKGIFPQVVLAGALVACMVWGAYDYFTGPTNTHAMIISFIWAVYNLILLMAAVVVARQRPQLRSAPRLMRRLPCQLRYNGHAIESTVLDISETGLSLTMGQLVRLPPAVEVTMHGTLQERTTVHARVVRNDRDESGRIFIGIEYVGLTEDQHHSILRQMYGDPDAWRIGISPAAGFWPSFILLLTSGLRAFFHEAVIRRFSPRVRKELRCDLLINGQRLKGLTEDIGLNGLSVRLKDRLEGGKLLKPGPVQCVLYPGNGREIGCGGEIMWIRSDVTWPIVGILLVRYDQQELEQVVRA